MSGEVHQTIKDIVCPLECIENENGHPLSCAICDVKLTSSKILQRHLDGKKHKMRAERQGKTFVCEICDIVANSEKQLNIHLNSSKHRYHVAKTDYAEFTKLSFNSGVLIILGCAGCVFINFLLLLKFVLME